MKIKAGNAIELLSILKEEKIETWFDLGLFLDRIKQHRQPFSLKYRKSFKEFTRNLEQGTIAFLTFQYAVDGVSIEIAKYSKVLRSRFPSTSQCYISGDFRNDSHKVVPSDVDTYELMNAKAFGDWPLYTSFFFRDLNRGSDTYNRLIKELWKDTLNLVEQLSQLVIEKNLSLLYLVNVNSNPGNVSLALATVITSEYLHIPVINNSHDFYWEGGAPSYLKSTGKREKGPRDFFFRNAHIGELFSIIEMIYPWDSPLWMQVTINATQKNTLIHTYGHNPSRVTDIGTAIDLSDFKSTSKRQKINTFYQFERILSRYEDVLVSYSVEDVLNTSLVDVNNPRPILLSGKKTKPIHHFLNENIIFLQPTRIITRKQIEVGFDFLDKFIRQDVLQQQLTTNENVKITLLVTGPIATGHYDYFKILLEAFQELLSQLPVEIHDKLYLAFLFSELDKEEYRERFTHPVAIADLYNISSLVLLPSKTEGRGLPIIEAAAAGVPIFCNRYAPLEVFNEVIGKHLPEKMRLRIFEYNGRTISKQDVEKISHRIFFPHLYVQEQYHNHQVIHERYSLQSLKEDMERILRMIHYQSGPGKGLRKIARQIWKQYPETFVPDSLLSTVMDTTFRKYIAGLSKTRYMVRLKSLIDPSAFREELQIQHSYLYGQALKLCEGCAKFEDCEKKFNFFKGVEALLLYHKGKLALLDDHSFPYRFRNRRNYPYQDYTLQELTGAIHFLFVKEFNCKKEKKKANRNAHFFTDWQLAMIQLTGSYSLEIDNRELFVKNLQANIPIAYFPGQFVQNELELIVLQSIRSRLELSIDQELSHELLQDTARHIAPVYLFVSKHELEACYSYEEMKELVRTNSEPELRLIYEEGLLEIVPTEQYTVGIHFQQMGKEALKLVGTIRKEKGILITTRSEAVTMTDIVGIDRIHIGKAFNKALAAFLGIELHAGFIQFVPAHLRSCLFFPTPLQTGKDLYDVLNEQVLTYNRKQEKTTLATYVSSESKKGFTPVKELIRQFEKSDHSNVFHEWESVSGIYSDGNSWNGVLFHIEGKALNNNLTIEVVFNPDIPKSVLAFAREYTDNTGLEVIAGWNGGYILNAELVGKLGLPEIYIGSPLGLLVLEGVVKCPPLFNKPAFIVYDDGHVVIERVNCSRGISVSRGTSRIIFDPDDYNELKEDQLHAYFDLVSSGEPLICPNKNVVRLAGNKVLEILAHPAEPVELLPVGITLVVDDEELKILDLEVGSELTITIKGMEAIRYAVEAGPLLVQNGNRELNMTAEGWTTANSIKTQAARLDYTDMRGPKIAVGLTADDRLLVLAINGRIRESVGATHEDMADLLIQYGAHSAMGFDPGGSSTLIVEDKQLNISPYNHDYLRVPEAAPPEPRFVSSAIFVTKKP